MGISSEETIVHQLGLVAVSNELDSLKREKNPIKNLSLLK